MPKFAANLTMLFTEAPFLERFSLAKSHGFDYVEYLFPYAYTKEELKAALDTNQLTQVLFNLPPGDWDAGERGIACLPDRLNEFRTGVGTAIEYAEALGVNKLNCLSGLASQELDKQLQWDTLVENVRFAAQALEQHNMTLLVEPINSRIDMPGFYLDTLDKANRLLNEVGSSNLKIQYDFYHMQIMHGDVLRRLEQNLSRIGHIQFADNPGRHEPGTGELNYSSIFQTLDALNYQGFASAEYRPKQTTSDSLSWFK